VSLAVIQPLFSGGAMSELIQTVRIGSDPNNLNNAEVMERSAFYAEQIAEFRRTGRPSRYALIINVLVVDPDGKILLARRPETASHNPGLVDKIGTHLRPGETPEQAMKRCLNDELGNISIFLIQQFSRHDLVVGKLFRLDNGSVERIEIGNRVDLYCIEVTRLRQPSTNVMVYSSPSELLAAIGKNPSSFTEELQTLANAFAKFMDRFIYEMCE